MRTVAEAVGWDGVLDTLAERMASSLAPLMDKMPPPEWTARQGADGRHLRRALRKGDGREINHPALPSTKFRTLPFADHDPLLSIEGAPWAIP